VSSIEVYRYVETCYKIFRAIRLGLYFGMPQTNETGETFGEWLLHQCERGGPIEQLAAAARVDHQFPRNGSPEDVRLHLSAMQANDDWFGVVDDAEIDWLEL